MFALHPPCANSLSLSLPSGLVSFFFLLSLCNTHSNTRSHSPWIRFVICRWMCVMGAKYYLLSIIRKKLFNVIFFSSRCSRFPLWPKNITAYERFYLIFSQIFIWYVATQCCYLAQILVPTPPHSFVCYYAPSAALTADHIYFFARHRSLVENANYLACDHKTTFASTNTSPSRHKSQSHGFAFYLFTILIYKKLLSSRVVRFERGKARRRRRRKNGTAQWLTSVGKFNKLQRKEKKRKTKN